MLQSIGMVAVALGIVGVIWGIFQKVKAGRVADAPLVPTGDAARRGREVAGPKGQISAQGAVVCSQPLIAPFSGTPCLYYRIKCTAEWKEGDTNKSKVLDEQKVAAQFAIDDGSGQVFVDAREGGDFEPTQWKRETKGTGLLGGITGTEITFGNYRVQSGMLSMGTKYSVEEEVMPLVPRVYACGRVAEQGGAITAPGWRSLILSQKSRDELLSAATKGAKTFLLAGAGVLVLGTGMAVAGAMMGGDEPEAGKAATTSASASASADPTAASTAAATTTAVATTTAAPTTTATAAGTAKSGGAGAAGAGKKPVPTSTATSAAKPAGSAKPASSATPKK